MSLQIIAKVAVVGIGIFTGLYLYFKQNRNNQHQCRDYSYDHDYKSAENITPPNREEETCVICLANLSDFITHTTPCGHTFHCKCFAQYELNEKNKRVITCPICREVIFRVS